MTAIAAGNRSPALDPDAVSRVIDAALAEDLGEAGDVTTRAVVPPGTGATGRIIAKQDGVVCGIEVAGRVFTKVDEAVRLRPLLRDGARVRTGDTIAEVSGPASGILAAERTALNLLQRMSGVATMTADAVARTAGTRAAIYDTRKTTPGLRALEKYAVAVGGGINHRAGLYDGILVKDNHVKLAGGVVQAVAAARAACGEETPIEVETETLAQVAEAVEAGADVIMLDNMSVEVMTEAVELVAGRATVEASGGIGLEDVEEVAGIGVDRISMGAITDAVRLDISLEIGV